MGHGGRRRGGARWAHDDDTTETTPMPLTQGLHRVLQTAAAKPALCCGGVSRSWAEVVDRVARFAAVLQQRGVGRGDRVALLAPNSDRYIEALLALWWLGAVAVPLNTRWSRHEHAHALADCDVRLFLVAPQGLDDARRSGVPVLCLGDDSDALLARAEGIGDAHAGGDTLAAILYTGGTTGRAKGVMLSHANLWVSAVARMAEYGNPPEWVSLIVAPLFHVAGLGRVVSQVVTGSTSVVLPAFQVEAVLDAVERHRVNDVVLVPSMLQMLLDDARFAPARLASLKRVIYGASPMSPALLERAMKALPQVAFTQVYGMTESAASVSTSGPESHAPDGAAGGRTPSAGRAGYANLIRVCDEAGRELPRGQVGEVVISGPNLMLGYWRQPEETAKVLRNGWYHSGDAAWMDAHGCIHIVDRLKDMIVSGGENVYPAEVEAVLIRHPAVAQCAVIGVPNAAWGEAVHAVIVLRPGERASEASLRDFCREYLAGYKCPKTVEVREALPMSAAGKVLKNELRAPHWSGHGRNVN
jgi:long-chain acyl-CoA synthetase